MSNSDNFPFKFSTFSTFFKNTGVFATLFSSLAISVSILSFNLPKVSVNATVVSEFVIVTHPNGVNIRDKDCKVVDQVNYGQVLRYNDENISNEHMRTFSLSCSVAGEKLQMAPYGTGKTNTFVATKYTEMVNNWTNGLYTTQNKVSLDGENGVNLRDDKCQRVATLPNKTYSENFPSTGNTAAKIICKAGGEFYMMIPFVYQGKIYQVAQSLTKFE